MGALTDDEDEGDDQHVEGEGEHDVYDAAELRRAAEETRGHFYRLSDVNHLATDLPPGRQVPSPTPAASLPKAEADMKMAAA